MATQKIVTPKGELNWVRINGRPLESKREDGTIIERWSLDLVLSGKDADSLKAEINEFWDKNGVRGKPIQSKGYKPEMIPVIDVKTGEKVIDTDTGKLKKEKTGRTAFKFATYAKFKDGSEKKIRVVDAGKKEVDLGGRYIGNGSIGLVSGIMKTYDHDQGVGVGLFPNEVQLLKYEEYQQDSGFVDMSNDPDAQEINIKAGSPEQEDQDDEIPF